MRSNSKQNLFVIISVGRGRNFCELKGIDSTCCNAAKLPTHTDAALSFTVRIREQSLSFQNKRCYRRLN